MIKKLVSAALCVLLALAAPGPARAARTADDVRATGEQILIYKKQARGVSPDADLFAGDFLNGAGSTTGDWYPVGMAALGLNDDFSAYLTALRENVRERYASAEKLSANKATEWHRVILAALACGADPTRFCLADGAPVNLVNDGIFYRENIGRQGINGVIWALITLHAYPFPAPADAVNTERTLTRTLLDRQRENGGWTAAGDRPDPDLTAMALTALSPLYGTDAEVAAAADRALALLSDVQTASGAYAQDGVENCESCAVAVTALCSLGIDPETDARFVKPGGSVLDALLRFRLENGSFTHAFTAVENDPAAVPYEPNDMACQQALYALGAVYRLRTGGPAVFDYSAASLSDEGWDTLPAAPGAAEQAVREAGGKLRGFFEDQANRRTAVTASLAVFVAAAAVALLLRARKRRRA